MVDASPKKLNRIKKRLTVKCERKQSLFEEKDDPVVEKYVAGLLSARAEVIHTF